MSRLVIWCTGILACLNIMDGLTTYIGLMSGIVEEANECAAWLIRQTSIFFVAIVVKGLISVAILSYVPLRAAVTSPLVRVSVDWSVLISCPYYAWVVVNNTTEIIKGVLWLRGHALALTVA